MPLKYAMSMQVTPLLQRDFHQSLLDLHSTFEINHLTQTNRLSQHLNKHRSTSHLETYLRLHVWLYFGYRFVKFSEVPQTRKRQGVQSNPQPVISRGYT